MKTDFIKNSLPVILLMISCLYFATALQAAPSNDDFLKLTKDMQAGEWRELPGNISQVFVDKEKTQGNGDVNGPLSVIVSWNGAAWDDSCGYFLGGGHADYGGNEVYSYCWKGMQAFRWQVLLPPSKADPDDKSDCPHPKEGPRAYHTYDGIIYVAKTKSIFIWGTVGYCQGHMLYRPDEVPELVLEPKPKWILHPKGPIVAYAHTAYNNKNGKVYIWQGNGPLYTFDPKTHDYALAGGSTPDYSSSSNMLYDSQRNVLWTLTDQGLYQFLLNPSGEVTEFKLISAADRFPEKIAGADGMVLRKGKLYTWSGNNIVNKFDPDTGTWTSYKASKGPTRASTYGIYSKWQYLDDYDVFVGVSHYQQGMWVWKPDEGKGEADTRKISVCPSNSKNCTEYKFLAQALTAIQPGSTLKFAASHYTDGALIKENSLTLSGESGVSINGLVEGKATFVAAGNDLVFENMDIALPNNTDFTNEACFRGEGVNLTLKNIVCHDMQLGIIGGPGLLKIEHSRFEVSALNVNGDLGHLVYACANTKCPNGSLEIRDSTFSKMGMNRPGHGIKSRAPKNLIENVVISGLDFHSGRAIDISQGGETVIKNVVMEFGENSDNNDFIGIALEYKKFPMHENTSTRIENVIAICDQPGPCELVRYHGPKPILKNIVLIGNFAFHDDLYPLPRDEIKIFPNREAAGLPKYPYIPEKWLPISGAH